MNNITYRKLSFGSEFDTIRKNFFKNFKKKLSKNFYLWRYQPAKNGLCFIALKSNKVVGHVAFVKYEFKNNIFFAARHSSFVNIEFRRRNIYSSLVKYSLQQLKKEKILFVQIWPNDLNIKTNKKFKNLIKLQNQTIFVSSVNKNKIKLIKLRKIDQLKKFVVREKFSLINKNIKYYKWRYFEKKPREDFYIHIFNQRKSLFIFNYNKRNKIYYLLEHLGKKKDFYQHLLQISDKLRFALWVSEKEKNNNKFSEIKLKKDSKKIFYSYLIPLYKKNFNFKKNSIRLLMGDTDSFIQGI